MTSRSLIIGATNLIELFQIVLNGSAVLDGTHCISKLQPCVLSVVLS